MMTMKYEDDKFVTVDNEFEQIALCRGMYISAGGTAGAVHLFKECFNNALDECNAYKENGEKKSPANHIIVTFNESTQEIMIQDNGRGIPFEVLDDVLTKKHTSSKIGELHKKNKESAGCNGVGLKVVIAFSEFFSIRCDRGNETKIVSFTNWKKSEGPITKNKKEIYGTTVFFKPSPKYLGEFHISDDDLLTWFRHMSYIIHPDITIDFVKKNKNDEIEYTRKFTALSLAENVKYFSSSLEFDPITIGFESDILDMEFSFSYDKTISDEITDSYANYVITVDGGYHEMLCKRTLTDFFVRAAKNADPDSKYEVFPEDCRKGLIMAINMRYALIVLGGQTKTKVENKEIIADAKPKLMENLREYFRNNNGQLQRIIQYLRQMARIRIEAYKIKGIKPPKNMTVFEEADIRDYHGVSDRNYKGYKELIITEGKSAAGAILNVRNPKYQAIYTTSGVMANTAEMTIPEMLKSRVPHDLAAILGVEIGPNADMTNLRFNKIICLQDADADGYNIKSLVCTYLITAMPQLVEEGRLYTGVPPLYTLSEGAIKRYKNKVSKSFLFDKHEYQNLCNSILCDNVKMFYDTKEGLVPLTKGDFHRWLISNRTYLTVLDSLSKKTACHPDIIEYVCDAIIASATANDKEKDFKKRIEKVLTEMKYDLETKSLSGSYKYEDYYLIIDDLFKSIAKDMIKLIAENECLTVAYINRNADEHDRPTRATTGQCLKDLLGKYNVDISQRFKGLGEVSPQLLFYSTLNPKVRKLIRLTMEDRKQAMESVLKLHGKKYAEVRKQMLLDAEVDDDDIDN